MTVDKEDGVTPFMIACEATSNCDGMMQSSLYRVFDQSLAASHEWYKPSEVEILLPGERHHVDQGGLLLRRIKP